MGIDNVTGNVFFISQPVFDATTAGDRDVFTIERGGNVSIGNNLTISSNIQTGNLAVTSNISTGNVSITDNLTVSGDTSVTGTLTTGDITGDASLAISGDVSIANDLSVTGTITTSDIVGGSPLTISTASNVQILTSNVGIGTVPFSNTRVHIQGGSTASITNSNVFPNFIFSRNANASLNHVGSAHNTAKGGMLPDEDGRVWAVGNNAQGGLGLGDQTNRNKYTLVSALEGVANIVASSTSGYSGDSDWEQTILLDDTGNVWTCGQNTEGQLGQDDSNARYIPTLVTINIYSGVSITEVSCGTAMALALDSTGQIWGCGANANQYRAGNLSDVTSNIYTFVPSMPDGGPHVFDSIDAGWQHSLALENDGRIWSTGANLNGRTGQGTDTGTTAGWTLCPDGTTSDQSISTVSITQISVGESHSIARDSTGNVWVTGYNNNGQLGLGDSTDRNIFERVTSNVNVAEGVTTKKIVATALRSFALDTNGRIWSCGYNFQGSSGQPPPDTTVNTFTRADAGPIANKSITDFALSGYGSPIVRTSDNEYWVTGFNEFGQLGTGDTVNRHVYTKLLDVNANPPPDYGYTRSLLLENTETGKGPSIEFKNSDAVSSRIQMEDGTSGKLNIGFVDASYDPKLSGGDGTELYPFQERAQSNTMTRGVTINQAGGTMVAGGSTSNVGFNTPVLNSGLPGTANYGYGSSHWVSSGTSFITTEGKVYFAGDSTTGQSGNGTYDSIYEWIESTPRSAYPIVAYAQGSGYTQALDADGQLWATGYNVGGQLGVGDTTNRNGFTASTSTGTLAITCGDEHTVRINVSGYLEACGKANSYRAGTGEGGTITYTSFVLADGSRGSGPDYGAMYNQKAKSIWASYAGIFAIRHDDVLCFAGYNSQGGGGVDSSTLLIQYYTPCDTANYGSETPVQVSNGQGSTGQHSMMITAEGNIYGTGNGYAYKTGLNDTADVLSFTQCTGDIQNVTVTRVSTCDEASIAVDSTGNVWITGAAEVNGQLSTSDSQEFTKVTLPAEFYSKTIVNVFGGNLNTFYAVDSEGTMWGVGSRIRGLGQVGSPGYVSKLFTKVPIYDVVPKSFQYTPTLTLENPNADHGATVEFKNPNNRAFINLDDRTSTLRLGFVDNENNTGQFKGIGIKPDGSMGLPWFYARNVTESGYTTDYTVYFNSLQAEDSTMGSMYNTSRACTFPVKGVYMVDVTVHSVYAGSHQGYYTGDLKYADGTTYMPIESSRSPSATGGNYDNYTQSSWVFYVPSPGMYLNLRHLTTISNVRNYRGEHNRIRAACLYRL
jgi:alpha-tubulin suppressor-like RCC1 family protein